MSNFNLRRVGGPILLPIAAHAWESRAVFNPGTVRDGNMIHMLYRAVEGENFSTIGYAKLNATGDVVERSDKPVIMRETDLEKHGCEDPRVVQYGDTYYIFYTAFDGAKPKESMNARIMLAETKDFQTFHKIGCIGPDVQDKDAMIFSEPIGRKVVFVHRILPGIQIAFFDDIDHLIHPEARYWKHHLENLHRHTVLSPEFTWEYIKIGAGPPPIRTEAGWLLIYHGVDKNYVYRAGAALLEEKNPLKVVARFPYPILEPEMPYEKLGDVNMVVFPEGIVQFNDDLLIHYGAADKVIGLATCKLSEIIDALWKTR